MMTQLLQTAWLSSMDSAVGAGGFNFKRILIALTFTMMAVRYLQNRYKHRQITAEEENQRIEAIYEKDENGLYPWEADTDDSPLRVTPESKPIVNRWGPKRGRWR
ncbi:hypothetical protein [Enterococcus sp. AZ072]|uniref:hypothetical protein n=1 Tax=unclassified Enterococcus TaxID=2608891 RepID=UPI003D276093